jgi:hypothetical protein
MGPCVNKWIRPCFCVDQVFFSCHAHAASVESCERAEVYIYMHDRWPTLPTRLIGSPANHCYYFCARVCFGVRVFIFVCACFAMRVSLCWFV